MLAYSCFKPIRRFVLAPARSVPAGSVRPLPHWPWAFALAAVTVCAPLAAFSAPLAELFSKQGAVDGKLGSSDWASVEVGVSFSEQDSIRVGRTGRAGLQFADGGFIRLSNGALLRFESKRREQTANTANVDLESGQAHILDRLGGLEPEISTPYVSAAARGTEFVVAVENGQTRITVLSGVVAARNQWGETQARRGEEVLAEAGKAPVRRVVVDPVEAVQWTLRLPASGSVDPVLSEQPLSHALAALDSGSFSAARSLLLSISGDPAASADIRASAYGLLAMLAVVANQDEQASQYVTSAKEQNGQLALVNIAESYVLQSRGAIDEAERTLSDAGSSAEVSLRRAELLMMANKLPEAKAILDAAPVDGPLASEANTLRGFVALQENDVAAAQKFFALAIALDSAAAMPVFGQGLVRAKKGDIDGARNSFMAAVSLEPTNGLFRSYLGKAYFEIGAEDRAIEEIDAAIQQDGQDPTPFLYRSFVELSQNRPVDALHSIEESIARNNNRAVYRSGLLLDQDTAVRSASIGRIFDELGLQSAARNEALRSLSYDYLNYSAHQLLADATDGLNEADASFSEQRIASLLAPLSLNTLATVGGRASFNEYSAVFDSDQLRSGWNFTWDDRDDLGAIEGSLAMLEGKWGFSLLYQGGMGDGSKENDYQRDHRLFANLEYQAAPDSRIRLNLEGKFIEYEDSYQEPQNSEYQAGAAELSFTQQLDSRITWLSTVRMSREDTDSDGLVTRPGLLVDLFPEEEEASTTFLLDEDSDEDVSRVQASTQVIAESDQINAIVGAQFNSIDPDRSESSVILDDETGVFADSLWQLESDGEVDLRSMDAYGYLTYRPLRWLTATGGASLASLEYEARPVSPFIDQSFRDTRVNPKVGLLAEPVTGLFLRASYFETLAKSTLEDQSAIEPTVVGGFSQRFNDQAGTRARVWAGGIDYKIPSSTYLGVEWMGRWLREESTLAVPVFDFDFSVPSVESVIGAQDYEDFSRQDMVRAYAAQILGTSWVVGLDYQWTELRRTDPDAYESQQTNRIGGALRYFHPCGFFAATKATWRSQDRSGGLFVSDGLDQFWIFDAELGYRLPRRRGKLALEFLNIGGENFEYDQAIGFEPAIAPDFAVLARAEFNF